MYTAKKNEQIKVLSIFYSHYELTAWQLVVSILQTDI
jgi:hypothetical protein